MTGEPIIYDPMTDTMLVDLRPWPGGDGAARDVGGADTGEDLVIHVAPDGRPWAWEIEHASRHPDLVARALRAMRAERGLPDAARGSTCPAMEKP